MRKAGLALLLLAAGCPYGPPKTTHDVSSAQAFAVDPTNPDVVLAVHAGRLERTTDGGKTWVASGPSPSIATIAWTSSRAWALGRTNASLEAFTSTDRGLTFVATSALPADASSASTIAVDASDDRHACVAAVNADPPSVFTTRDAGATWTRVVLATPLGGGARDGFIAFDAEDATTVWAAFDGYAPFTASDPGARIGALLRSRDGGSTFAPVPGPIDSKFVTGIAARAGYVFIATLDGLVVSEDDGATWRTTTFEFLGSSAPVYDVAVSPIDPRTVFVVSDGTLRRSSDAGATFTTLASCSAPIAIAPSSALTIYSPGRKSTDGGTTFSPLGNFSFDRVFKSQGL